MVRSNRCIRFIEVTDCVVEAHTPRVDTTVNFLGYQFATPICNAGSCNAVLGRQLYAPREDQNPTVGARAVKGIFRDVKQGSRVR